MKRYIVESKTKDGKWIWNNQEVYTSKKEARNNAEGHRIFMDGGFNGKVRILKVEVKIVKKEWQG